MTFHELFADGEVGGAVVTVGIIAFALLIPSVCDAARNWHRSRKESK